MEEQKRLERIKSNIGTYPDFPKKGIVFRDVFPLFYNPSLLEDLLHLFQTHIESLTAPVGAIVGLESRGFLIGPSLALRLGVAFVPVRKAGKLPGKVRSCSYELEYGSDTFEVQESSISPGLNCVIVDDLLATGGSLKTAIKLIQECGANVIASAVIIELCDLGGRQKVSSPLFSLVQY